LDHWQSTIVDFELTVAKRTKEACRK